MQKFELPRDEKLAKQKLEQIVSNNIGEILTVIRENSTPKLEDLHGGAYLEGQTQPCEIEVNFLQVQGMQSQEGLSIPYTKSMVLRRQNSLNKEHGTYDLSCTSLVIGPYSSQIEKSYIVDESAPNKPIIDSSTHPISSPISASINIVLLTDKELRNFFNEYQRQNIRIRNIFSAEEYNRITSKFIEIPN